MYILGTLYILTVDTVLDFFSICMAPFGSVLSNFPLLLKYVFSVKK